MDKIDYRKEYHEFYAPPRDHAEEITVPPLNFAMIDGVGAAEGPAKSPEFQDAIAALYGITYTLKIGRKKAGIEPDYTIGPLEGLWWMDDGSEFDMNRPDKWRWTLMIFQPEFIGQKEFQQAVEQLMARKPSPALNKLRLERFDEGKVVQIMHIGPYATEEQTIKKLEDYVTERGYTFRGEHHEIYFGDPRRTKPEKLKTVLRHPIE